MSRRYLMCWLWGVGAAVAANVIGCATSKGAQDAKRDIASGSPYFVFVGDGDPARGVIHAETGWRLKPVAAKATEQNARYVRDYNHTVARALADGVLSASRHLKQVLSFDELEAIRRANEFRPLQTSMGPVHVFGGRTKIRLVPFPDSSLDLFQLELQRLPASDWRVAALGVPSDSLQFAELHDGETLLAYHEQVTPTYFVVDTVAGVLVRRVVNKNRRKP